MSSNITNNASEGCAETSQVGWLEDLLQRVDALPSLDSRTADEILGYEDGIPS
jgi:hypothetical protein